MKKMLYFIPVLLFLAFTVMGNRLFASGSINPMVMIVGSVVIFGALMFLRPKAAAPKPVSDVEQKVRGDFAKDAFLDKEKLNAKFQSALKDYSGSMPKSATAKLEKLAPQCTTDAETYAVAMALGMCYSGARKYREAAKEFTRALSLHPTAEIAFDAGSCYQRIGQLKKAMDSYEFALDLDPENLDYRSALATAYVADRDYETGLEHALLALEQKKDHPSALATAAICYGLLNDPVMSKYYADLAVDNGYKRDKIEQTITALKKR